MEIKIGSVVKSKAGRDKNKLFVVLELDGDFAHISDGKLRPIERPKLKKQKHLLVTGTIIPLDQIKSNKSLNNMLNTI